MRNLAQGASTGQKGPGAYFHQQLIRLTRGDCLGLSRSAAWSDFKVLPGGFCDAVEKARIPRCLMCLMSLPVPPRAGQALYKKQGLTNLLLRSLAALLFDVWRQARLRFLDPFGRIGGSWPAFVANCPLLERRRKAESVHGPGSLIQRLSTGLRAESVERVRVVLLPSVTGLGKCAGKIRVLTSGQSN
jgi:hypothetical protein